MTTFNNLMSHISSKIRGKADGLLGEIAKKSRDSYKKSKPKKDDIISVETKVSNLLASNREIYDETAEELRALLDNFEHSIELTLVEYENLRHKFNRLLSDHSKKFCSSKLLLVVDNNEISLKYSEGSNIYFLSYPECKYKYCHQNILGKTKYLKHHRFNIEAKKTQDGRLQEAVATSALIGRGNPEGNNTLFSASISDNQALFGMTSEGVEIINTRPLDYVEIKEHFVQDPSKRGEAFINPFGDNVLEITFKQFVKKGIVPNSPVYSILIKPYPASFDFLSPLCLGEISYNINGDKVYIMNNIVTDPKVYENIRQKIYAFGSEIYTRYKIYNSEINFDKNNNTFVLSAPKTFGKEHCK